MESSEMAGMGRRSYDDECRTHRELTDQLQASVDKSAGRWTAMLWFLGVIGAALMAGLTFLISITTTIQSSLNKNDIVSMQHSERIESLRKDIDEIKTRNRYIDQQSTVVNTSDKHLKPE